MLPSELLIARVLRGHLQPLFLKMTDAELYIAEEVVGAFKGHVGRRRRELEERLAEVEEAAFRLGVHYKVVRGLAHVLYRRATFTAPELPVEPARVRLEVFRIAGELGAAVGEEERRRAVEEASRRLGLTPAQVEEALKCVDEGEETLARLEEITPEELVREYNLSAAQTVLFKALDVKAELRASGTEVKHLLRWVKRLGLMYTASMHGDSLMLSIEGPASLLKLTERYGTRLAKILPFMLTARSWRVEARIKGRHGVLRFELDSRVAPPLPVRPPPPPEYDSSVEKEFYRSFLSAGSGWTITREPEPLVAGGYVLIPDFAFEKNGVKVYMEIVGFWTPDYLRRKLEKLRALTGVRMIVAVDEEGACASSASDLPHAVILFRRKVPVERVYKALKSIETQSGGERVRPSSRSQVPLEALKLLESAEGKTLACVLQELSALGLSEEECFAAIKAAGFQVEWRGLDPSSSTLRKIKHS